LGDSGAARCLEDAKAGDGFAATEWEQIDLDPLGSRQCTIVRNKPNQGMPRVSGIRDTVRKNIGTAEARACVS